MGRQQAGRQAAVSNTAFNLLTEARQSGNLGLPGVPATGALATPPVSCGQMEGGG